jgi:4-amino-4-deoxy-L-arabinose transferase-like glycosyltransferase
LQQSTATSASAALVAATAPRWKIVLLQLIFVYLLALKLAYDLWAMPLGDEAYYWMWGRNLSWSYFDHPPLNGWLQGLAAALFGWSTISVRLMTWPTLAATLWIIWLWSGRLAPSDRAGWFWHSAVIYLCMPVIFLMTSAALPDHLLIPLGMGSIYAFHGFAESAESGAPRWRSLLVSAALLGLAVLTKYNGVFIGIGYVVWILIRPKLRGLFLDWRLWGAALLAVAMQAPVLYWNATEGAASFRFHLAGRGLDWSHPQLLQTLAFIGGMMLSISPVLFGALFRLPLLKSANSREAQVRGLATSLLLVSTLFWAVVALFLVVYFHWNIVAYLALAPIAYRLIGGRIALWLHIAWGLLLITPAMLNYMVTPLTLPGLSDPVAGSDFGWPEIGAEIARLRAEHPSAFLAATRYTYAAQLGLILHDTGVAAFNPVPSQNDYWFDAPARTGDDALIIADRAFPIDNARASFASLAKLEDIPVVRFGQTIWTFEVWLGTGFKPTPRSVVAGLLAISRHR